MKLLLLLACIQLCRSHSPPFVPPEPVLQSSSCNDSLVKMVAGFALNELNSIRKEGYVFSLNRIADAHEHGVGSVGTVFYLVLDLLETVCHVLSKRVAKDCENRPLYEAVYGQCNTTYYLNRPGRIARLYNYNCVFHPVVRDRINSMCPDCPIASSPNSPIYLETAKRTLQKFNQESNETNYFSVLNITKASMQWVVGPSHFVEYTIQETTCSKHNPVENVSTCEPMKREFSHFGLCKGSVMKSPVEEYISVSCEIYEPEKHQPEPGHDHDHKDDHDGKHHHGKKGHKEHGHHHPHHHGRHHGHGHNDSHCRNNSHVQLVGPPGAEEVVKPVPLPSHPGKPHPHLPPFLQEAQILPFPETHSESNSCPGEFIYQEPLL